MDEKAAKKLAKEEKRRLKEEKKAAKKRESLPAPVTNGVADSGSESEAEVRSTFKLQDPYIHD